jgi:hypothetical protein
MDDYGNLNGRHVGKAIVTYLNNSRFLLGTMKSNEQSSNVRKPIRKPLKGKGKFVHMFNYLSTMPRRRMGEWMHRSTSSVVRGQLYSRYPLDRRLGVPQSPCGRCKLAILDPIGNQTRRPIQSYTQRVRFYINALKNGSELLILELYYSYCKGDLFCNSSEPHHLLHEQ